MNKSQSISVRAAARQLSLLVILLSISAALLVLPLEGASSEAVSPSLGRADIDGADSSGLGNARKDSSRRELSVADRVSCQHVIEEVYWRHRIWPNSYGKNRRPKPLLDEVMSMAQIQRKVEKGLRDSELLAEMGQPIAAEQLQSEMDRMARDSRQPDVLRELFDALQNDPFLVAECLVRPSLSERLLKDLSWEGKTRHDDIRDRAKPMARSGAITQRMASSLGYALPQIATGAINCTDDTWVATSTTNAPSVVDARHAVWTGSEMIVWSSPVSNLNTSGRYNPSTDTWETISTVHAPSPRAAYTTVWTGTEMIVWGGGVITGARYNPATDSWDATTTANAPSVRDSHTAVWTGREMIIWGGFSLEPLGFPCLSSGGRYDPSTDIWTPTTSDCAPVGRWVHTAVWTGSEMIVWGGNSCFNGIAKTGGRYNPDTDSWIATTTIDAPAVRWEHTAVWTGSEMIVWGGDDSVSALSSGGRYNPTTDSWVATNNNSAPEARNNHTAVWTGGEMLVWGGGLNTGGRYNPITDNWVATNVTNAPDARTWNAGIWTGNEMIVWGGNPGPGYFQTGGKYCAQSPTPTPAPTPGPRTPTPTPNPPAQAINLSTRLSVQSGDRVGIGGFIIEGTDPKQLLLRGIGPSLAGVLSGVLGDPELELHGQGAFATVANNNWRDTQEAEIQATGIAPTNDLESAILISLDPGAYTVILRGHDNGSGIGLVEVYDLGLASASKLGNISTRGFNNSSESGGVMIAGFTLGNSAGNDTVIIRGIGPSLAGFGIMDPMADPNVRVFDSNGATIADNDDWMDCSLQAQQLIALGRAPTNLRESAIVERLAPGAYTAAFWYSGSGIALIEVYDQGLSGH